MDLSPATYSFAFLAGLLSTLSPCVLPIVPVLLGSAMNAHRRGPIVLAAGLAISYATIGTMLAWAGTALELNTELVRRMGAALLGLFALTILSSNLQPRFAAATSGVGNAGNRLLSRLHVSGVYGQFVVGLVLGMI
jgi:cytochrome c biogenesis protein CcdA